MNVHLFLPMVDLPLISAVTSLSVHPSGKLALSVGTDATLRTWNLVKGRQAYATNLGK
jgi:protein MAK11